MSLNLDTLEREATTEPFDVTLGKKNYVLLSPDEYDYNELLAVQTAIRDGRAFDALVTIVKPADREKFFANSLPAWKVNKLLTSYNEHHGLPSPGEASASSVS